MLAVEVFEGAGGKLCMSGFDTAESLVGRGITLAFKREVEALVL